MADAAIERGVALTTTRKTCQAAGSLGPAVCMGVLAAMVPQAGGVGEGGGAGVGLSAEAAAGLFVGSVSLGAASAGGFAASLLDVSARYSGFLYGITTGG